MQIKKLIRPKNVAIDFDFNVILNQGKTVNIDDEGQ
jgi:hypothetical protein